MEGWMVKLMALAKMVKFTALVKEKTLINFISTWKPLWDFCEKLKKMKF